jgi:hypothetical protein
MRRLILVSIIGFLAALLPGLAVAQTLLGPNYKIEDSTFDSGGEQSNSANYKARDSIGDSSDSGSNSGLYRIFGGFVLPAYPGIPIAPTLVNTGGTLYNSLDFVLGLCGSSNGDTNNCADTNYAVAISSDNFVTTYFVQNDDTLGAAEAWQTYANWGSGLGERIVGLSPSTAYKIKVKARYGANSETGYSFTATASTAAPNLTIAFAGVNSGTSVDGETTSLTTAANDISYGSLTVGAAKVAAHKVTVTTNAAQGYATTLQQDGNLRTAASQQISPVSAPNSAPAAWPVGITTGAFGYHTTDTVLCTGSAGRFTGTKYAALTTTPEEVACSTTPVSNEATTIVYKLEIGGLQANGRYNNIVTYITTAQF